MNFGMTILNQNMETEQFYVTWIPIALFFFIITEDSGEDIANDAERWFDTSNVDENDKRPLPIGKNKNHLVFLKMN